MKHARAMNVSGDMLPRFGDARKIPSRKVKEPAMVESTLER